MEITRKAFGKINLALEIHERRPDGYHDLSTVMQSVGLYDLVTVSNECEKGIHITCDLPYVPLDERNIVWKATEVFYEKLGKADYSVKIDLRKRIPVGGGMAGDLAGFAAACFMRGVDFYNIPTTLLSQVDSSIGGKTGVNLDGVKNIVGAFWQPQKVLIDPDTLDTLSPRLYAEGMAEAVKMALASDEKLFEQLEQGDLPVEELLYGALSIKKAIVEQDERESGIRKLLNFGHTIGHGVESAAKGSLYHGECVAIGLLPMCSQPVRARLQPVLERLGLPTSTDLDKEQIWQAMQHDKKSNSAGFSAVFVEEIGKAYAKNITFAEMKTILEGAWQK